MRAAPPSFLSILHPEARAELDAYIDQRVMAILGAERSKRWMTVKETAAYLGVSEMAVRHRIVRGRVPFKRQGRSVLVDRVALDREIER